MRRANCCTSFGAGMFVFPHGVTIDLDGNVWVSDGQGATEKVIRFSNSVPMEKC